MVSEAWQRLRSDRPNLARPCSDRLPL